MMALLIPVDFRVTHRLLLTLLCLCHVGITSSFIICVRRGAPLAVTSYSLQDMAGIDSSFIIVDEKVLPTVSSPEIISNQTSDDRKQEQ